MKFTWIVGLWLGLINAPVLAQEFDLLLRGGRVADGTGNPAVFADVAVKGGRIAAVGRVTGTAKRTLDVKGLVVAPGFVDTHTHAEGIEDQPLAENFLRMGVTTLVLGNCGGSRLNLAEYFKELEATNISPNVCSLIGHNTVRRQAMGGSVLRPPTDAELAKMKGYVEQAMKDGAVGLATGLIYLPGTFAKTEEIMELAKVAGAHGGIYASHMRSEGEGIYKALDELFRIAREGGTRGHISHIKLTGKNVWGQTAKVIAAIEGARASGLDITQDQYVYPASSTGLSQLIPDAAREGGADKFRERVNDPTQKADIVKHMKETLRKQGRDDFAYAVIANYTKDKSLNGLNIVEAAKKKRGNDSLDEQVELLLEIEKSGGASAVFHGMSEEDLREFAKHPNTMFASDSGVRKFGEGVPHPRGYGNNARVLGEYVRELKLLRIEDAIRRMTSLPATTFQLKDRGVLREGAWADLVVFDPAKVMDTATFKDPHQYAIGFKLVAVNGVVVVEDDRHLGTRPGKVLRLNQP
ncbi:MAG: D-aminoacylase [Verrucomicrobia bacterium]|nr:D-aminoacylase [Verrucomicrobiota bacterium]NBU08392.1 D-aminoacylase [Pseudomonadota bacterium]NDA65596.1 D-aminoacylase [Verrucomicrobiota bacterium]NDB75337.1 D-aminoacylase [Verrucomicrobiota bacterium]NDD37424.1 D-aminoacylase [Verrucomicrobiota bacterium]